MVRDSLDRTSDQNHKREPAAETQSQSHNPEESRWPEQTPGRVNAESEDPAGAKLDFLLWCKLRFEEEPESWSLPETSADADSLPTHLRPFTSSAEYQLVKLTYLQLQQSGYYWGPMTMEEAHKRLTHAPLGTFLLRDSGQPDVFFTLSYQSEDGPTSVRVQLNNLLFSLHGSQKTFTSLFALLAFYTSSPCKLTEPYRRQRPERLKQMCRRALVQTHGVESIRTLHGLSPDVKAYVCAYPYCT
ncbi:suppressor of cytokine signaling 1-like [Girardinichthys multiradiatus]|uniref:suppressor of cytokine signaling 1-like n=1 Tax=Girardinichthys multiradiatus TaxID=208333 RepID=UPI001FAD997A|nr:suppressor of cytokine signaling 1-like [Girardinichthys multiradiatus]XP_047222073.1 suppressor of cytokine signaling 1-like [Girardinichthys multiradiatus]